MTSHTKLCKRPGCDNEFTPKTRGQLYCCTRCAYEMVKARSREQMRQVRAGLRKVDYLASLDRHAGADLPLMEHAVRLPWWGKRAHIGMEATLQTAGMA